MNVKNSDNDLLCADLPTVPRPESGKILVAGAGGYIGGRLVPELLSRGYEVRAMVRADSGAYRERWPGAEIVAADAMKPESLAPALNGIHSAYYLIHSLLLGEKNFAEADIQAAGNFQGLAQENGVERIIYLGGLGDIHSRLSAHLKSRSEVARMLQSGSIPVTILRAAVIIGSGSASYEIIANLIRNFRVLLLPAWSQTRCQPIAVRDIVKYLVGVLETPVCTGQTYDIGGPDILTYEHMLKIQAELTGKKVLFQPISFSHPGFNAYIASLFIPVPAPIIRSLMAGLDNEVICQDHSILEVLPFPLLTYREALLRALSREEQDRIHTRWSDSYPPAFELTRKLSDMTGKSHYTATYFQNSDLPAEILFAALCQIGGKKGWFHSNWLWQLRGGLDRLLLGIGSSRGRRSGTSLRTNDVIDFWRVEELLNNERLLLRAEMKLPGQAWLEFRIAESGGSRRLSSSAFFYANSLWGKIYWFAMLPFHHFIFKDLLRGIISSGSEPHASGTSFPGRN